MANFPKQSAAEQPLGRHDLGWRDSQRKNLSAMLLSKAEVLRQQDAADWNWDLSEVPETSDDSE